MHLYNSFKNVIETQHKVTGEIGNILLASVLALWS